MIHSEEPNACLARELACPDSDRGGAGRRDCGLSPVRDGAEGGDHLYQGRCHSLYIVSLDGKVRSLLLYCITKNETSEFSLLMNS